MLELDADQAAAYRPVVPDLVCLDALDDQADVAIDDQRLLVAGVADPAEPGAGDALACFGFAADGTRLDGSGPAPLTAAGRRHADGGTRLLRPYDATSAGAGLRRR